jgi:NarL family two-component system response regulator LiaR
VSNGRDEPSTAPGNEVVLVVDDNEEVLRMLSFLLGSAGYDVVTASTLAEATQILAGESVDAALVDLHLGSEAGQDLVELIASRAGGHDEIATIVISADLEPSVVAETLALGAVDYVRKPFDSAELVARVQSALRSKRALDEMRRQRDTADPSRRTVKEILDSRASLTDGEKAVAARAAQGLTNREIATDLFVSIKTVEFHLVHVFRKLGVANRTQLAVLLSEAAPDKESDDGSSAA